MLPGHALGNQVSDLCVSCLGLAKPGHQTVVMFLVFRLIEGDVSIFFIALFDELGSDGQIDFRDIISISKKRAKNSI